jgi:hypothetical protein
MEKINYKKKKKNTRTHTNKCGEVKEESVEAMEAYV